MSFRDFFSGVGGRGFDDLIVSDRLAAENFSNPVLYIFSLETMPSGQWLTNVTHHGTSMMADSKSCCYMSHCQNSSKFLSIAYFMKNADVIMFFFSSHDRTNHTC